MLFRSCKRLFSPLGEAEHVCCGSEPDCTQAERPDGSPRKSNRSFALAPRIDQRRLHGDDAPVWRLNSGDKRREGVAIEMQDRGPAQ